MLAQLSPDCPLEIAIIGCGITGPLLALGLATKNISITIYEQAPCPPDTGAGIAFTANARKCMALIDPRILDCLAAVATTNGDPNHPNNNMRFVDGYTHSPDDTAQKKVYELDTGPKGFEGCHRGEFLSRLVEILPCGVRWGKRLDAVVEVSGGVVMRFCDGSIARADAVIGCDGIKSRVRELLLGEDVPASYPHFTHKVAYRGLVPMEQASARLGHERAHNQQMYGGPGAHVLHFPVAQQRLVNVVAFVTDGGDWGVDRNLSQRATKEEVAGAFADWGATVRAVVDLLPAELEKWAVFDSLEFPAPTYARGRVCIAGDAAHASSPHHGAGAGIGVEDVLALTFLLGIVSERVKTSRRRALAVQAAFAAFSVVRRERSQWVVKSSREACEIYEWNDPHCGSDMDKAYEEIKRRSQKIWHFDIDGMLRELELEYGRYLAE
ncbi:hypothetical protein BDV28DRAFT_154751 [Aspergillus coremiiformis]|uniref:FAD-binding domain-containing protein n=1 Tax=Aspergillus coremiiformis TaxID=138285 RepID=A0A5N6ZH75_9EURO|nr:hypothetical protein BDV28DRAFT_154751 [Aspergillus coremiiformis]